MIAAKTVVPVLGVPVASRHLQGGFAALHRADAQGRAVATFAIGARRGAANAALFAVACWRTTDPALRQKLEPSAPSRRPPRHDAAAGGRMSADVILPGATLGVLGGGQLGPHVRAGGPGHGLLHRRARCRPTSPAGLVSHHHIRTGYEDADGLAGWRA